MSEWASLRDRVAGKWQLPLLGLSILLLAGAIYRIHPTPARFSPTEAVKHLDSLVTAGMYARALDDGVRFLAGEGHSAFDRAPVHRVLAKALFEQARQERTRSADIGQQIVEHYQEATSHGQPLTAADEKIMGRAWEWQGRFSKAIDHFNAALQQGAQNPLDLRRHLISLRIDHSGAPVEQLAGQVDEFLADIGDDRLKLRLWAVERRIRLAEEMGTLEQAATLLARNHDDFERTDLRDRFSYLEAWLLHRLGHYDEAEVHLRTIRNRVEHTDELYARTGWLLGQVVMGDEGPKRPQQALSFYADVLTYHSDGPYTLASRVGSAEALAMLERHEEAIEAYRVAIEQLEAVGDSDVVSRDVLRTSLGLLADTRRQRGQIERAVEYAELAVSLVDPSSVEQTTLFLEQLGQLQSLLADQLEAGAVTPPDLVGRPIEAAGAVARAAFAEAAATYLELARLNSLNERRASDSSWRAAEFFARAGERERAANLYQAFVAERPEDPLVPRALLRIGQLKQVSGHLEQAVEAYKICYRRFPRTLDGARALVPLAQCYLGMGPDYEELAEKTLRVVLQGSEIFTPQAPEFADALFLLGAVLNTRGEFERAIGTLNEVLERYPNDQRVWQARFLLADSYRQSGLALNEAAAEATIAGEIETLRVESTARFREAQQLYRQLVAAYELRGADRLERLERMYLRHAYLYEADCVFETRDYRQALKRYEEAAATYRDTTSALAAYVQIINSHVFLGQPEEARAALARAIVMVDAMPDEAFANPVSSENRQDWKRYFEWLQQAELF